MSWGNLCHSSITQEPGFTVLHLCTLSQLLLILPYTLSLSSPSFQRGSLKYNLTIKRLSRDYKVAKILSLASFMWVRINHISALKLYIYIQITCLVKLYALLIEFYYALLYISKLNFVPKALVCLWCAILKEGAPSTILYHKS